MRKEMGRIFMACYKGCHIVERLTERHRRTCRKFGRPTEKRDAGSSIIAYGNCEKGLIEVLIETDEDAYRRKRSFFGGYA